MTRPLPTGGLGRHLSGSVGEGLALLVARLALASVFWRAGRSKVVDGTWLQISDGTRYLFEHEYAGVPLLPPELAAQLATWAEFGLPLLLLLGLGSRLAATGLLGMTAVIQVFVYPDAWPVHLVWAGLALVLISRGSGLFSFDAALARITRGRGGTAEAVTRPRMT